jgi:hypothetical protein
MGTGDCMLGLVSQPEGKRPLGRPNHWCEYNIKIDIYEVGRDKDWIGLDMALPKRDCEVGDCKYIKFGKENKSQVQF